jgi:hypothetical protein
MVHAVSKLRPWSRWEYRSCVKIPFVAAEEGWKELQSGACLKDFVLNAAEAVAQTLPKTPHEFRLYSHAGSVRGCVMAPVVQVSPGNVLQ